MEDKIALLVIYNHRYDKNISRVEELYKGKFSYIYHIVPFYDGEKENVLGVFENSYNFSGYIAQAYQHLKNKGFTYFFFVADDMIINPFVSETNFFDMTGINRDESYIGDIKDLTLQDPKDVWFHAAKIIPWRLERNGAEVIREIPTYQEAVEKFLKYGLDSTFLKPKVAWMFYKASKKDWSYFTILHLFGNLYRSKFKKFKFDYPIAGGYSDILGIPAIYMDRFAHYCGAFAATRLFVEMAIPTSLLLSSDKMVTDNNTKLKGEALWGEDKQRYCEENDYKLSNVYANYGADRLFVHPVKLSQWE